MNILHKYGIELAQIDRQLGILRENLPKSTGQYVHSHMAEIRDSIMKISIELSRLGNHALDNTTVQQATDVRNI